VKTHKKLSKRDILLLSVYLDDECSRKERKLTEELLQENPAASSFLNDLKSTRELIAQIPDRKVPRNFTISRSEAGIARPLNLVIALRVTSAVSALFLGLLFFYNMFPGTGSEMVAMESAPAAEEPRAFDKEGIQEDAASAPIIIFQGGVPQGAGVGMGGGGGEPSGTGPDGQVILPDAVIDERDLASEAYLFNETEAVPESMDSNDDAQIDLIEDEITSPILGIRPQAERGGFIAEDFEFETESFEAPKQSLPWISILQIFALIVSVLTFTISYFVKKRRT